MVCGTAGTVVGIVLIVVPVVVYQWDNFEPPLQHDWPSGTYPCLCILLGGIGGTLMVPSSPSYSWPSNTTAATTDIEAPSSPPESSTTSSSCGGGGGGRHQSRGCCRGGYRWVGGLLGGALSSGLAYLASWMISLRAAGNIVDLPLILFCGVPGLILYSLVHQCSDYTFPPPRNNQQYGYQWIPPVEEARGSMNHDRNSISKHQRPTFSTVSPTTTGR
eukprot:CAMPEP_0113456396 /NCGR_PEP_ID=MMETSP0014_2-20120614/8865_1 /TAXON_ID=2857 /ORGANISM="Nitzschia sp." /LENGTH=217 /DNA_ID=CAMNT_0000347847 /DNA_START=764 /DNA_END=1417 /DNA_ORIENTATION=+ /assembly_acc=CAM_ASM_000159